MNRLEWTLGILLALLLLVVVVLSLLFWFRPETASNRGRASNSATVLAQRAAVVAPTSIFEGRTAKVAFAKAQQTAAAWRSDAKLLNASATWPQGASVQELKNGTTTWGFTFYSPAAGEIGIISVVDDTANLISEGPHKQTNPVLEATGWNLDSDEVIALLLAEGGNQFLIDEGVVTLTTLLNADDQEKDGRLAWQVNLISIQNGRALSMNIDATSGEILEIRTVP